MVIHITFNSVKENIMITFIKIVALFLALFLVSVMIGSITYTTYIIVQNLQQPQQQQQQIEECN